MLWENSVFYAVTWMLFLYSDGIFRAQYSAQLCAFYLFLWFIILTKALTFS